jgi:hypothetical protein
MQSAVERIRTRFYQACYPRLLPAVLWVNLLLLYRVDAAVAKSFVNNARVLNTTSVLCTRVLVMLCEIWEGSTRFGISGAAH